MNDTQSNIGTSTEVSTTQPSGVGRYGDAALMPPVDVFEDSNGITLFADLPGVSRDKLHLQVEGGTLTIDAELNLTLPESLQSSHTEVGLGRFHRSFALSAELDADKVSAELTNGVLRLTIPKAEHAKPRRISISAG
jgi:HSP20 family molecular chaperone IbpA